VIFAVNKRQQNARHVLLSGYAATGDTVARDKMIAAIERAAGEQQKSYRAVAVMAAGCLCLATLVKLVGWLFGLSYDAAFVQSVPVQLGRSPCSSVASSPASSW
jgi:hypothetical protein